MSPRVNTYTLPQRLGLGYSCVLKTKLRGYTGSVLALEYAPDKRWLFSPSVISSKPPAPSTD
ncbi:hypothetical protein EDB86DRAFT_3084766 [Lactarius hatsudake]|nr:hypothetical protein EDB86DRAFT_3084766 [Lactarius hatsudake]